MNWERIEHANVLVEDNPLEDLIAVTNKDNLKTILKDGKIYNNTLN